MVGTPTGNLRKAESRTFSLKVNTPYYLPFIGKSQEGDTTTEPVAPAAAQMWIESIEKVLLYIGQ